jgi:hypothetical protein
VCRTLCALLCVVQDTVQQHAAAGQEPQCSSDDALVAASFGCEGAVLLQRGCCCTADTAGAISRC